MRFACVEGDEREIAQWNQMNKKVWIYLGVALVLGSWCLGVGTLGAALTWTSVSFGTSGVHRGARPWLAQPRAPGEGAPGVSLDPAASDSVEGRRCQQTLL